MHEKVRLLTWRVELLGDGVDLVELGHRCDVAILLACPASQCLHVVGQVQLLDFDANVSILHHTAFLTNLQKQEKHVLLNACGR